MGRSRAMIVLQNFLLDMKELALNSFFFQTEQLYTLKESQLNFHPDHSKEYQILFDGIANSFPIQTFFRHTNIREVRCRVSLFAQDAVLGILHYDNQGKSTLIEECVGIIGEYQWESSLLPLDIDDGRYTFFIRAKGAVRFFKAEWLAEEKEVKSPRFLVSIPAYKRNASVLSIVSDFCQYNPIQKFDCLFLIIDHGHTLSGDFFPPDPRIRFISQMNFGPTGGFMRAFLYAKEVGADFIITADDDILVFPEMFYRLMILQSLAISPLMLGTMMMTIQNPTIVSEQGARIQPNRVRFSKANHRNTQTLSNTSRSILYQETVCDYAAWWLSCSPVSAISILPPYFMRGDDVFEGIMAKKKGYITIVPPHCFVWHEAFSLKASHVRAYLSFRNDLANKYISGGPTIPIIFAWSIFRLILLCIANFDYDLASTYIKALKQFMRSPDWINDPLTQTNLVHTWIKEETPPTDLSMNISKTFMKEKQKPRNIFFKALRRVSYILSGANYLNPFAKNTDIDGGLAFRYHGDFQGWGYLGYRKIAVIDPDGKGYICQRSWKYMISITLETITLIIEFLFSQSRLLKKYQASNMQEESWKKAFT